MICKVLCNFKLCCEIAFYRKSFFYLFIVESYSFQRVKGKTGSMETLSRYEKCWKSEPLLSRITQIYVCLADSQNFCQTLNLLFPLLSLEKIFLSRVENSHQRVHMFTESSVYVFAV